MGREARSRPRDRGGSSDRLSVCSGVNLGDGCASCALQTHGGFDHGSLRLQRHTLRLVGRSRIIRRVNRPAARLYGAADRMVHPLLPPGYMLRSTGPVESDHQSVHCVLLIPSSHGMDEFRKQFNS